MTRHARNCTAGAVYTYNEKKKDAAQSGYGINAQRINKDSVKSFDCCSLTLQPCRNPVITKDGYLFDKEAMLQYIITKKIKYSRRLKEYEKMKSMEERKSIKANQGLPLSAKLTSKSDLASSTSTLPSKSSISNMANGNDKKMPSFWLPSESPSIDQVQLEKPDPTIYCPISNKPLRVKDLIDVKFTAIKDGESRTSLIVKDARYMCPVTHDVLSNALPCAVLAPTGDVVTMECVEKIIKKDMVHPLTNQKLKPKDIIPLQRGGTGFASTNINLESKEIRPMLQA